MSDLGFTKICDDVPLARVEQREDGNPGANMGAGRNVEVDDPSGKSSDDLAVRNMEFLEIDGRDRTFALSLQGCYCGSGLVDGLGGGKAMRQEWLQAVQGVLGLGELLIQSGQFSFSLFQDESVILRIDFKKHGAFLYRLVILHIQLDDLTTHTRRNAHHIGPRRCVVGARVSFDDSPNVECYDHRAGDDDQTDDFADELALFGVVVRSREGVMLVQWCGGLKLVWSGRYKYRTLPCR